MKKFSVVALLFLVLSLGQVPVQGAITTTGINANNIIALVSSTSQYVRIEGEICDSEITDNSKVIFLNFGKNFNTSLSALIYNVDIPAFIDAGIYEPEEFFKNKNVIVEGILRMNNGKPEIVLNSPNQIKIIEKK